MSNDLISICIPTFNRPEILKEAVESCLLQDYRPLEILIGDDSPDESSQEILTSLEFPQSISLDYRRNTPALGQAENVNSLFDRAIGDRLLLLHDDDLLISNGLDRLAGVWDEHCKSGLDVAAVFGKQYLVSADGEVRLEQSESLNQGYARTSDKAGVQDSAFLSGLTRQFPNDAYLVRSALARSVRCRSPHIIGRDPDMDFGIRLGLAAEPSVYIFLDEYTAKYRLSLESVSRSIAGNSTDHLKYEALCELIPPEPHRDAYESVLGEVATRAVPHYSLAGKRGEALRIFLSSRYKRHRLSPKGIYHLLCIFCPALFLWREQLRLTGERRSGF